MKGNTLKSKILILLIITAHTFMVIKHGEYHYSLINPNTEILQNFPEQVEIAEVLRGWTETALIFNESTANSWDPAIATDKAGNVYIVWDDRTNYNGAGTDADIFYIVWNATTRTWGAVKVISFEHNGSSMTPSIAVDGDGHVHVAWADYTNYTGAGTDRDIFYRRWNAITRNWLPTVVVSNVSDDASESPDIEVDIQGNAHVVWHDLENYNDSGPDLDIFYRSWNASTDTWTITQVISNESSDGSGKPSIAVGLNGSIYVVWQEVKMPWDDILYKHWNATTRSWSGTELISTESQDHCFYPGIAVDGTGYVHVLWNEENPTPSNRDIMYKLWNATAGNWTATEEVSAESNKGGAQLKIAMDCEGNVHIAWRDLTNLGGGGPENGIFYNWRNATTGNWSSAEVISTESPGNSERPTIAVDGAGYVHIAWIDNTNLSGTGTDDLDIFYKRSIDLADAPILNAIVPNPDVDGIIELNWSDVNDTTIYYVYRDTSPITNVDGISPIGAVQTSNYTDMIMQNGMYYYAIIAGFSLINSSLSNCENVTIVFPLPNPTLAPIKPNPDLDGRIELNWSAVTGATFYYIYRNTSPITSIVGLNPIKIVTNTSCVDTITTNGMYYYVLVAGNASGNSSLSNCEGVQVILINISGFEFYWGILGVVFIVVLIQHPTKRKAHKLL